MNNKYNNNNNEGIKYIVYTPLSSNTANCEASYRRGQTDIWKRYW